MRYVNDNAIYSELFGEYYDIFIEILWFVQDISTISWDIVKEIEIYEWYNVIFEWYNDV